MVMDSRRTAPPARTAMNASSNAAAAKAIFELGLGSCKLHSCAKAQRHTPLKICTVLPWGKLHNCIVRL